MSAEADALRKLAAAVRERDAEDRRRAFEKAAHVLLAAKGLTLLREKVRGSWPT